MSHSAQVCFSWLTAHECTTPGVPTARATRGPLDGPPRRPDRRETDGKTRDAAYRRETERGSPYTTDSIVGYLGRLPVGPLPRAFGATQCPHQSAIGSVCEAADHSREMRANLVAQYLSPAVSPFGIPTIHTWPSTSSSRMTSSQSQFLGFREYPRRSTSHTRNCAAELCPSAASRAQAHREALLVRSKQIRLLSHSRPIFVQEAPIPKSPEDHSVIRKHWGVLQGYRLLERAGVQPDQPASQHVHIGVLFETVLTQDTLSQRLVVQAGVRSRLQRQ